MGQLNDPGKKKLTHPGKIDNLTQFPEGPLSPPACMPPAALSMKCKAHFSRWGDKELVVERGGKGHSKKGAKATVVIPYLPPQQPAQSVWPTGFTPLKDLSPGFHDCII